MKIRPERHYSEQGQPQSLTTNLRLPQELAFAGIILFALSLSAITCFAHSSQYQYAEAAATQPARLEIPFELYNDNLVIVKVTVDSVKSVNMILDTGANPSAISRDLANHLKLRGKTEMLVTLNGAIPTQTVVVSQIQLGPLHAESVRIVVQDLDFMEKSLGISLGGIVGLDVLKKDCFTIDYKKRRIVFGPIDNNEKTMPFETRAPFVTVKVNIDGQELRLLVDSGTWGILVFRNRLKVGEKVTFNPNTSIESPGGKTRVGWIRARVSLGQSWLAVSHVAIAEGDPGYGDAFDGLFGFGNVGLNRVSFDLEKGLFGWD